MGFMMYMNDVELPFLLRNAYNRRALNNEPDKIPLNTKLITVHGVDQRETVGKK